MKHTIIFLSALAIIAALFFVPTISAPPSPLETVCIFGPTPEACAVGDFNLLEECREAWEAYREDVDFSAMPEEPWPYDLSTGPQFFPRPDGTRFGAVQSDIDMWNVLCETGCCEVRLPGETAENIEGVGQWYCENNNWGDGATSSWGATCDEILLSTCSAGQQGPCMCGDTELTQGQYCCDGQQSTDPTCGTPDITPPGDLFPIPDTCGNERVDLPGEQCDGDIVDGCSATPGVTPACTAACRCAIQEEDYDQYPDYCNPTSDCAQEVICSEEELPAPLVRSITATNQANITWGDLNLPQTCQENFLRFEIVVNPGAVISIADPDARSATFTVTSETQYTITLNAYFEDGTTQSAATTFTAGHEMCFGEQRAFCVPADGDSTSRYICDADNSRTTTPCGNGVCYPGTHADTGAPHAICQAPVNCDLCNGAFSNFGEVRGATQVQVGETNYACDELGSIPAGDETGPASLAACYLDFTTTALQEYSSCSIANGCFQYRSQSSCETNVCGAPGDCAWNEDFGVCTAEDFEHQTCGSTTEDACLAEGAACRWVQGEDGGMCQRHSGLCRDYSNQETCTGEQPFVLNQQNYQATPSQDALDLGKCVWGLPRQGAPRQVCYRDADGNGVEDQLAPALARDFTNPVTSLLGSPETRRFGSDIVIEYVVSKPNTQTYTQLVQGACTTITNPPTSTANAGGGEIEYLNVQDGTYCLHYFSRDASLNTEHVRQAQLVVNTTPLVFEEVTVSVRPSAIRGEETLSRVDATVRVNQPAWCTVQLQQGASPVAGQPQLVRNRGTQFALIFNDLPDGQYSLESECWLLDQEPVTNSTNILLDADDRITRPIPPVGTYRNTNITTGVGIHTQQPATCFVNYQGSARELTNTQEVFVEGERLYRHTTSITFPTGVYNLTPYCEFTDFSLTGGPADRIIFAIDEQAPRTTLRADEQVYTGGDVTVGSGRDVQIECVDPEILGSGNWESECQNVFLQVNGEEEVQRSSNFTFTLQPDMTIRVYGVDGLGNREAPRTFRGVDIDVSGPSIERFWIVSDGGGER